MDIISRIKEARGFVGNAMHIPRAAQEKARRLCWQFNNSDPDDPKAQRNILMRLFGTYHSSVYLMPSFHCDFGFNVHFKGFALVNYNCTFLDTSPIHIGRSVLLGPGVVLSCAGHPLHPEQRCSGAYETSEPITLEDGVWIGANATVCGGVTIGEGSVIGAGSVVVNDIPPGVIAAGVPCKVIREITDADRIDPEKIEF
ncbi:MAG: sugar O-acetyltransferase [Bacteroidales bacterium]|nr:sugar O-acetyltransferase [Bacteroidales bacterium]